MKKKRKKLRLMSALMLGATVFSPTEKALGMDDNESDVKALGVVTRRTVATKSVLAGDTFVKSTLSAAASSVLQHLNGVSIPQEDLVGSLQALYAGGIGKVMARERSDSSTEDLRSLIIQSLDILRHAQNNPFDTVIKKQLYTPIFGMNDKKNEIQDILGDKSAIQRLFAANLSRVMEETPNILNSFLAYLPQTPAEKQNQEVCTKNFVHYFTSLGGWIPKTPLLTYREKKLQEDPSIEYQQNLTEAAKVYGILLQREKNLIKSKPSAEIKSNSAPASLTSGSSMQPRGQDFASQLNLTLAQKMGVATTAQPTSSSSSATTAPSSKPPSSVQSVAFHEPELSASPSSVPRTFRTTGANPAAKNKHSAILMLLQNQEMQDDAFQLIVNHRTIGKGPMVRVYDPKAKTYANLGSLTSSLGFNNEIFELSDWVKAIRDESSIASEIVSYLSFLGGTSDIHSFTIRSSGGKTLKEVIFGDSTSELQPGIHVYGPETDENANEWSKAQADDVKQPIKS